MIEERRKNSENLLREMRMRAAGWSTLQRLAVFDMLGTLVLREGISIEALTQQVSNIIRKAPEFQAIDPSPNCSPACPACGGPAEVRR